MPVRRTSSTLRQFLIATDKQLHKELRGVVEDTSAEEKLYFEGVVKKWKNKPKFRRKMLVSAGLIQAQVQAIGENAKIWRYVDEGTKAHEIVPKNAPVLRFKTGYSPRTRPGSGNTPPQANAGSGTSSGDWVHAKKVQHPGTEAREFAKSFEAQLSPSFQYRVEAAIRRAVRRAK